MAKIDEQISYNWLFFLLAGAFGAVTFWAVYDETVTRREYKGYQEAFFGIETTMTEQAFADARDILTTERCTADADFAKKHAPQCAAGAETHKQWKAATAALSQQQAWLKSHSKEFEDSTGKLQDLEFTAFDKQQEYTFTKSNLDEKYYYFTLAKHELTSSAPASAAKNYEARKQEYDTLVAKLAQDEVVMNQALAERDCFKKGRTEETRATCKYMGAEEFAKAGFKTSEPLATDAYDTQIKKEQKNLEDLERPMKDLERKYLAAKEKNGTGPMGMFGPATEIVQENLEDIGRVDRCESCHMASSRGGFENVKPDYFRSHPYRRTLLGLHPPEKFGCTTCHDGQGRATQRFHAHAYTAESGNVPPDIIKTYGNPAHYESKHFWEFPLLKGAFMESECRQCHRQEVELRANLKCETDDECPTVEGQPLKCRELIAPINPSTNIAAANTPAGLEAKPESGRFCGVLDAGDDTKVAATLVDLAPHLSRGRKVIEEVACYGCHPIEGYENRTKAGPDLRHAASKLSQGWMVEWILNPKSFRPHTRMPNFFPERLAAAN